MAQQTGMQFALIICCAVAFSYESVAVDSDGSNLGLSGYPEHSCGDKPLDRTNVSRDRHPGFRGDPQLEIEIDMMEDEGYDLQLSVFNNCIDEYINSANNDIKLIREAITAARDEAKR